MTEEEAVSKKKKYTKTYIINGKVQGVMFRQTLMRAAQKRKLEAGATNTKTKNKVHLTLSGDESVIKKLIERLKTGEKINSWGAKVTRIAIRKNLIPLEKHQVNTKNVDNFRWNPRVSFYI